MPICVICVQATNSNTGAQGTGCGSADGCDTAGCHQAAGIAASHAMINGGWAGGNIDEWTFMVLSSSCQDSVTEHASIGEANKKLIEQLNLEKQKGTS